MLRTYRDKKNRVLFVSDGISTGRAWGTFYRKPSGSLKRLVSCNLPMRPSREVAQADLDAYAKWNRLEMVHETP